MADWFYVAVDGQEVGPVADDVLRRQAAAGALTAASLVWQDGMGDWVPAGTLAGLLPPAGPAAVPVDPGPFQLLGKRFSAGNSRWVGRAVASPVALYLLKVSRSYQSQTGFGGGAIGMLLSSALSTKDSVRTCAAAELPADARAAVAPKTRHA